MALEGLQLGQYSLVSLLGVGGMGEVYLAEDVRIGQRVAVKVSRTEGIAYPTNEAAKDAQRLFQREARAIARLDHPRILPLYTYGEERIKGMEIIYIVMPYRIEGSFADWLQRRRTEGVGLLSTEDIAYFIRQAASALQYAHDNHIIHQDVKPANFLIRDNPEQPNRPDLLLADFGIARMSSGTASESHTSRGTPTYMAPEQWRGNPVAATDQYALAIMTYELLAGRSPFTGRQEQVMYQHLMTPPSPPSSINHALSPAIDAVILRALAKQPADRYPSIADFARELQNAIVSAPTVYAPLPPPTAQDIRATLVISDVEAREGTTRSVTLPGGKKTSVAIPKGAYDGQILRLFGEGIAAQPGGTPGNLVLVLSVVPRVQQEQSDTNEDNAKKARASDAGAILATEEQKRAAQPIKDSQVIDPTVASSPASSIEKTVFAPDTQGKRPPASQLRKVQLAVLIGVILVVVLSTVISFSVYSNNVQLANTNATASAQDATSTAANETATASTTLANETATASANLSATVSANANPYPPNSGTLAFSDPLTATTADHGAWTTFSNRCGYGTDKTYHAIGSTNGVTSCIRQSSSSWNNFAYEVQMTIIQGDCGGLAIGANAGGSFTTFVVCSNGTYAFWDCSSSVCTNIIPLTIDHNVPHGTNQQVTIAIVVNNLNANLYVNQQLVAQNITLGSYAGGGVGVIVVDKANATDVSYTNARLWTL
jgi:eukaryotic-like serine/threonine-protein kinase